MPSALSNKSPALLVDRRGVTFAQKLAVFFLFVIGAFGAVRLLGVAVRCKYFAAAGAIGTIRSAVTGEPMPPAGQLPPGCEEEPPPPQVFTPLDLNNRKLNFLEGPAAQAPQESCIPTTPAGSNELPPIEGPVILTSADNGMAIDPQWWAAGRPMVDNGVNGEESQKYWPLQNPDGTYRFESNLDRTQCLGREGDYDGAPAILVPCTDARSAWTPESQGNGKYKFKAPGTNQYLNTSGQPDINANRKPNEGKPLGMYGVNTGTADFTIIPDNFAACGPNSDDPTVDEWTFVGSHNSYSNANDGYPPWAPNQFEGIDDQLAKGVRGFNFDLYDDNGTIRSCHKTCGAGSGGRDAITDLTKLVEFLKANPNEIVMITLEDKVMDPAKMNALFDAVPGLNELLFKPKEWGVLGNGWPKMSDMIKANQRLMIFGNNDYATPDYQPTAGAPPAENIMYDQNYTVENYWSLGDLGDNKGCVSRYEGNGLNYCSSTGFKPLHIMNNFRNVPSLASCAADNGDKLNERLQICTRAAGSKPNLVQVDCAGGDGTATQPDVVKAVNTLNVANPNCCRPPWCPPAAPAAAPTPGTPAGGGAPSVPWPAPAAGTNQGTAPPKAAADQNVTPAPVVDCTGIPAWYEGMQVGEVLSVQHNGYSFNCAKAGGCTNAACMPGAMVDGTTDIYKCPGEWTLDGACAQ